MAKDRQTTFATARRYACDDGLTYVVSEDVLELARQIAEEDKDLLDALAKQ